MAIIKRAEQSFSFPYFGQLLFQNRKKAGMYGLLLLVISFNLCLFLPANMRSPAAGKMVNAVQLICFGIMGIVNTWIFYKRRFLAELALSGAKLAFICLLFVLMALVLFVYYYLSGNNGLIMAFASSSAFLLPFLMYQGWREFMSIPEKQYAVWRLPALERMNGNDIPLTTVNTMLVQIKISRFANGSHSNVFPLTVSGKSRLGKIFEKFIAEQYNGKHTPVIEITDREQQSFSWKFTGEKWFGLYRRSLNPAMNLIENKLKPNASIRIERIDDKTGDQGIYDHSK